MTFFTDSQLDEVGEIFEQARAACNVGLMREIIRSKPFVARQLREMQRVTTKLQSASKLELVKYVTEHRAITGVYECVMEAEFSSLKSRIAELEQRLAKVEAKG